MFVEAVATRTEPDTFVTVMGDDDSIADPALPDPGVRPDQPAAPADPNAAPAGAPGATDSGDQGGAPAAPARPGGQLSR